jgi:hypothetical protein
MMTDSAVEIPQDLQDNTTPTSTPPHSVPPTSPMIL